MRAAPGAIVSKAGAEGLSSLGILPGRLPGNPKDAVGLAIKIEDGDAARRAGSVSVCSALLQLGVLNATSVEKLAEYASPPILDPRGESSGQVRAAFAIG
jgi:L-asparaginase II